MLVGKQVKLRPVEETDLSILVEWRNRAEIWECFFNKFPLSLGGQMKWYRTLLEDRQRLLLIIEAADSSRPVGSIGFDRIDPINQVAEYGNLLIGNTESKGLGLAKEATSLLLGYGFNRLNLNRIFLHVLADNVRALEFYGHCGFREEGQLREAFFDRGAFRDVLIMAILRVEYLNMQAVPFAGQLDLQENGSSP